MSTYDDWKTSSPDDLYIPDEGCECRRRIGDYEWCPVHGRDPDQALDEKREREWDERHRRP